MADAEAGAEAPVSEQGVPPPAAYAGEDGAEPQEQHFVAQPTDGALPPEAVLDAGRNRALELAAQFAAQAAARGDDSDGSAAKRKLEHDDDSPNAKRPAYEGIPGVLTPGSLPPALGDAVSAGLALLEAGAGLATETFMCPGDKVGRVIGRAGATIRELEATTLTRIQVDHKAPSDSKPVTVSGKREDVDRAKRMILEIMEGDGPAPGGGGGGGGGPAAGEAQRSLECPAGIVGRIIGRGGETIRSLQQASGAHIHINQDFPEGMPRQITISGRGDAVDRAFNMVMELINGEPSSASSVVQKYGAGAKEVFDVPKSMVGRIIGKGGDTIKDLQKRFGTSIQIDQSSMPCKVTVAGPGHAVAATRRAIDDLLAPSGGPPPPFGGPSRPPGGGGFPPYPPAGGYGGGYGGGYPPAYPPAYPAGGYGGGYPGYGMPAAPAPYPYNPPASYGSDAYGGGGYGGYNAGGGAGHGSHASAPAPAAPSAPSSSSVWQAIPDDQGRTYYYNTQTGVSQWEKPADMQ